MLSALRSELGNIRRQLTLAWQQLTHGKSKLIVAILGVVFADVLMWMQIGFMDALFASSTMIQQKLSSDLVVINPLSEALFRVQPFPRRQLSRLLAHPDVESVRPMYVSAALWRNHQTGRQRHILVLGMDPRDPPLDDPALDKYWSQLTLPDVCLFDAFSRPEYGPVALDIAAGNPVETELNRRHVRVIGTFQLGASFAADGNIIVSDTNFLRLFPDRQVGNIDLGLVRLRPGADIRKVQEELRDVLGSHYQVLTAMEFVLHERKYWEEATAIGFVFGMGVVLGFVVGFVIVYQILFTDVKNHLPQYATLKAIGYTDGYLLRIVMGEALILAVLGFVPGTLLSWGLYELAARFAFLPMEITISRLCEIFAMTVLMCAFSGGMATRKLRSADPAEVF